MKSLKKLFLVLLTAALVFGIASCKNDDDDDDGPSSFTLTFSPSEEEEIEDRYLSTETVEVGKGSGKVYIQFNDETTWIICVVLSDDPDDLDGRWPCWSGNYTVDNSTYRLTKRAYSNRVGYTDCNPEVTDWKVFTMSDEGTFSFTLDGSDINETK